jgi:hypothetical protein
MKRRGNKAGEERIDGVAEAHKAENGEMVDE